MLTTPSAHIPYAENTDPIASYPTIWAAMAAAIDGGNVDIKPSLTAAGGWTITSATAVKFGPFVHIYAVVVRTGADMVIGSGGNLSPDVSVFTGVPAAYRPVSTTPGTLWRIAIQSAVAQLTAAGAVAVTDGGPSMTLTGAGTIYQLRMTYVVGV